MCILAAHGLQWGMGDVDEVGSSDAAVRMRAMQGMPIATTAATSLRPILAMCTCLVCVALSVVCRIFNFHRASRSAHEFLLQSFSE